MIRSTVSMTLAPGWPKMTRKTPRLPSAQPACLAVLGAGDRGADVSHPQRSVVVIGNDDVVPGLRLRQLIVGINREGPLRRHRSSLSAHRRSRPITAARTSSSDKPFRHQLSGVELDANRRLLLSADQHLRDTGNLRDLLREPGLDVIVDLGQRQRVGCRAKQQNGRIRRIDLAIGRRTSAGSSAIARPPR